MWGTMGSAYEQSASEINWDEWSRVAEAAQDPRGRDAVQKFLAQADLSAEVAEALDEKVLAPRRSEGATGEQCAYVLCNLGFASLAAGTRGAAEFAIACAALVEKLGPDTPDLELRRHFLSAKGQLVVAVLTAQPHLLWSDVTERCTAYLQALADHLDALPAESVESNAMAAYSFAGQCLARLQKMRVVEYYADEISQLVEVLLGLASRLPSTFVSRLWGHLIPGTDAAVLFRRIGAAAERSLQIGEDSVEHAEKGLAYIDQILARSADQSAPDLEPILQTKAELLLLSGRRREAREQAEALGSSSDPSRRIQALAVSARCELDSGNPQAAAESLAQHSPTADQAVESWWASWIGDTSNDDWTDQADAIAAPEDKQRIWRLQAAAAAELQDMPGFLEPADRSTGFLVDSLLRDRHRWVDRLRKATGIREPVSEPPVTRPEIVDVDPMLALEKVFARLAGGTALLQVLNTEEGILTWIARQQDGEVSLFVEPHRPNVGRLTETHKRWSRAYFDFLRDGNGAAEKEAECVATFTGLMDEARRNWGDLLQGLVDENVTQLIFIGDDLVDIPLHAVRIGQDERLIDRVPVTYVPSLSTLRACIGRTPADESQRRGAALCSLIDAALRPADADAVAAILETEPCALATPAAESFWTDVAAAELLHIVARVSHNARKPFESLLGAGWLDLPIGRLLAGLDLTQCDVVSNLHGESALPSMLRVPGLDIAALFLTAGARSVLASTWVAKDELASELSQSFFRRWVTGLTPSAAFREALLELRSERPALHDFHWAGMRLVGAP